MNEKLHDTITAAYCDVIIRYLIYTTNIREAIGLLVEQLGFIDFLLSSDFFVRLDVILTNISENAYLPEQVEYNLYFLLDYLKNAREFESKDANNKYLELHNSFIRKIKDVKNKTEGNKVDKNNFIRFGYYLGVKNVIFNSDDYEMTHWYDFIVYFNLISQNDDFSNEVDQPFLFISSIRYLLFHYPGLIEDKVIRDRIKILLDDCSKKKLDFSTRIEWFKLRRYVKKEKM